MRLFCFSCGKSVSNELPDDTVVRAALFCPECIIKSVVPGSVVEVENKQGENENEKDS